MTSYRMGSGTPESNKRSSKTLEPKKFYFIFTEGYRTEVLFFNALSKHEVLDKSSEIIMMQRTESYRRDSNQYAIVKSVKEYISLAEQLPRENRDKITKILDRISDNNFNSEDLISLHSMINPLVQSSVINSFDNLPEQINALYTMSDFNSDFDKICIVLDRDPESFTSFQYDEVLEVCEREDYLLGISNPNFEFFLLLHLSDMKDISEEDIKQNNKEDNGERLLINRLREKLDDHEECYSKTSYNCNLFIERFEEGKINSSTYQQDVKALKEDVGTSMFSILDEIIVG